MGRLGFLTFASLLLASASISRQAGDGRNLVYNGDLEMPAASGPPSGWAMWGAQQYKDPANYTRDTTNPHGGAACLRIHHPADTAGYLVTDPQHAIRPRPGMAYTLTFWARSDRPGAAFFGYTAYSSIQPFVDAPAPGGLDLQVGPEWKQYTSVIREGVDFFADEDRYLLLTFDAMRDHHEDRTLWVDDLVMTESPSNSPVRLLNMRTLAHAPLEHRLRPGDRLEFTIDARRHLRRATRLAGGVSFHQVVGWTGQPYDRTGRYTLDPRLESAIREMRLPMTRFYGVATEPFGVEGALDRIATLCRKMGIPESAVVLELEPEDANRAFAPEIWAGAVRYSLRKGYGFRHWEVGNEPYSTTFHASRPMGLAFPTPETYVAHLKEVSAAIRQVQPAARIGVGINPESLQWGNRVLREAAGSYDFVVPHWYSGADAYRHSFEDLVLGQNYRILDAALRLNALIKAYNPGRKVDQLDTEWGMISGGPKGEEADYAARNGNVIGMVHRAVRLIYYAREGMLRGASGWQMLSNVGGPGFGILSQQAPDKRFILYWLYYYFNRHVGEWALPVDGTAPYQPATRETPAGPVTPVLATLSADGKSLYLVIANGSWDRAIPLHATLRGFRPSSAAGVFLSQNDLDANPLLDRKEDGVNPLPISLSSGTLSARIPPHAAALITVRSR